MKICQKDLQESLTALLARHKVPGASVALYYDGEFCTAAAGVTNVNTGVELTEDTVMQIGSIAKVFTATLVMQLVDRGLVDVDAPVCRYLPKLALRDPQALEQIAVKMLLNHTSGIDGEFIPDHGHDEETIEKAIARFAKLGQIFSPGADFSYCNAATVVAGYLAQQTTATSWYRLIQEHIFNSLNLQHVATLPEEALLHRAAVGHYINPAIREDPVRTSHAFLPLSFAPAGTALMMSARSLVEFAVAHMNDGVGLNGARLISSSSAGAMRTYTVQNKGKAYTYAGGIGLGWMISDDGLLHHAGGGPGTFAVLYAHPRMNWAAAILTNADHGLALINELIGPWLEDLGTIKPFGMTDIDVTSTLHHVDPEPYVGIYQDIAHRYEVCRKGDGLTISKQTKIAYYENISTRPTAPAPLRPIDTHTFLVDTELVEHDKLFAAFRLFVFRNPGVSGSMQHLGNSMRLYRRVA